MHRWLVGLCPSRTSGLALSAALGVGGLVVAAAPPIQAQGVYTAAVQGTIRRADSSGVDGAVVDLTNASNGERYQATTRTDGRYALENVPVGGPYRLSARAVGFTPQQLTGIRLGLGQRLTTDFSLVASTVTLQPVTVVSSRDPLNDASRTGPASVVSDSAVHSLPSSDRDFQALLETTPAVSFTQGNLSIAGANTHFNNILVDGSVNNDLFGLADNGLPGGQVGTRAISLEAVDQLQLQVAPYDVRLGGFTGGLLNVVTKSGANTFHGSLFEYFRNQSLVGTDIFGQRVGNFSTHQFGGSISGPIVPDVAHFFLTLESRSTEQPVQSLNANDAINIPNLGYTAGEALQIQRALAKVGMNAGGFGPVSLGNPNPNVFGKVDLQLAANSVITLSENYVSGSRDFIDRGSIQSGSDYDFSSAGHRIKNWNSTTRADWTSAFGGRFSNDLIVAGTLVRDVRTPNSNFANIHVTDTTTNGNYVAGAEQFSQDNLLNQDVIEFTDNLTIALGSHHVTFGTHEEVYKFHNNFFPNSYGQWFFRSPNQLDSGIANQYTIALPLRPGGPRAEFRSDQAGFYVQDQWTPTERLSLSAGVRLDVPIFPDKPLTNPTLLAQNGINTGVFPTGNVEVSPRIGFNYDVKGDRSTIIRGGTGLFQGRPEFVWLSNAFSNNGVLQTTLNCFGSDVPTFTPIRANQPTTCKGGGPPAPPIPTINYFDSRFAFPQVWRSSLGIDHDLGNGWFASLDGLYTITEHQLYILDQNIAIQSRFAGEGNRPVYGAITDPTSFRTTPVRLNPNFGPILRHINRSGDYSYEITPQINKTFGAWALGRYGEVHASYTYEQSFDRMSLSSNIATSNYGFNVIDGTIFNRRLTPSEFTTPHQIKVSVTNMFPLGFKTSLFYVGRSGTPYSYAVFGDVSGTGVGSTHDLIYVPKNENDITLADNSGALLVGPAKDAVWNQLNTYINQTSCLSSARGQIIGRNACRNPWQNVLNARLAKEFTVRQQSVEFAVDIFNLPNLINRGWGQYKQYTPFEDADLFSSQFFDVANNRYAYTFTPVRKVVVTDPTLFEPSVWRMQFGMRYSF